MSQIKNMRKRHRIERLEFGEKILAGYIRGVQKLLYLGLATHPDPEVKKAFDGAYKRAVDLVGRDPLPQMEGAQAPPAVTAAAVPTDAGAAPPPPSPELPPKSWPQLCSLCNRTIIEPEDYIHADAEDLSIVVCAPACGLRMDTSEGRRDGD